MTSARSKPSKPYLGASLPPGKIKVAMVDKLTYADIDAITEELGIDVHDPDVSLARKMAICEWRARVKAGQKVNFDTVYANGSIAGIEVDTAALDADGLDPTQTPTAP